MNVIGRPTGKEDSDDEEDDGRETDVVKKIFKQKGVGASVMHLQISHVKRGAPEQGSSFMQLRGE